MPARLCCALSATHRARDVPVTGADTATGPHALDAGVARRRRPPARAAHDRAGRTGRRRTAVADIRGHRGTAPSPRGGGRPARRRVRQVGVQGVRGCAAQAEGGDAQAGVIRVERTVGKFSLFKGSSPRVRWVVAAAATLTPLAPHTFRYHA